MAKKTSSSKKPQPKGGSVKNSPAKGGHPHHPRPWRRRRHRRPRPVDVWLCNIL